jgi:hypothetical protein
MTGRKQALRQKSRRAAGSALRPRSAAPAVLSLALLGGTIPSDRTLAASVPGSAPAPVATSSAERRPLAQRPVQVIADQRLDLRSPEGRHATLPLYLSADWSRPRPDIVRAVISIHGLFRDADVTDRAARHALALAGTAGQGTLLVTPQFLDDVDLPPAGTAGDERDNVLRWHDQRWIDGEPASGPAPLSAFDAVDAILARLADRHRFPALRSVILEGHSAGGQFVQRYALVGHATDRLLARGLSVRFVVANPSSFAWLDRSRPVPSAECGTSDLWKYGLESLPPYATAVPGRQLADRYARLDVTYLLGDRDIDPRQRLLDQSCAAEAQGPTRFARGHNFFEALKRRYGNGTMQALHDIPGVGHNGDRMLASACGLQAVYGAGDCGTNTPR